MSEGPFFGLAGGASPADVVSALRGRGIVVDPADGQPGPGGETVLWGAGGGTERLILTFVNERLARVTAELGEHAEAPALVKDLGPPAAGSEDHMAWTWPDTQTSASARRHDGRWRVDVTFYATLVAAGVMDPEQAARQLTPPDQRPRR